MNKFDFFSDMHEDYNNFKVTWSQFNRVSTLPFEGLRLSMCSVDLTCFARMYCKVSCY